MTANISGTHRGIDKRKTALLAHILLALIKPGPGTQVIATGYPAPKTGNAANH